MPKPGAVRDRGGLRASSGGRDADGDSVLRRRRAIARAAHRTRASLHRYSRLQIELPPILRNFPGAVTHLTIFGAGLIQHGIRVVDVHIDFTWPSQSRQPAETAIVGRDGNVSHLPPGLSTALNADELIVVPESAVEKQHVGRLEFLE